MTEAQGSREARAAQLKERIYVTFAALAVVVSLLSHGHVEALDAIATLGVTVLGTLFAVFTADVISHLLVHERMLTRAEFGHAAGVSASALGAIVLPMLFLLAAHFGVWTPEHALQASTAALLFALIGFGWIAARRIRLPWWQRLLTLGAEAVLGLIVIGLQILAHGG
ncbi:hypothetical protein ACIRON_23625 [Nocardioides sp. NPDC101246]|uniref:hypothetical protein n=1 Tax=Nocardioides sp. NPDC101246 TaxID=3364336 RepID=UPI003825B3C6